MKTFLESWRMLLLTGLLVLGAAVLLVAVMTELASAEEDARVYGTVFDNKTREPLENVTINLYNSESGESNTTTSDDEGNYEIWTTEGNITLRIDKTLEWKTPLRYRLYVALFSIEGQEEKELDIYRERIQYGVILALNTDDQSIEGEPGQILEIELRVGNTGDDWDKFETTCVNKGELEDKGFSVIVVPTVTMDIDPMKYSVITVRIKLPKTGTIGTHLVELEAKSKASSNEVRTKFAFNVTVEEDEETISGFLVTPILASFVIAAIPRKRSL